jgi:hypothetical protein
VRTGSIGGVIILIWLIIGAIAAGQRGYFSDDEATSCAEVSTVAVTVVAGPLNYVGANPKVDCDLPEPSQ